MFTLPLPRRRQRPFIRPDDQGGPPPPSARVLADDTSSAHYAPLGFQNFPQRGATVPDRRTYIFPAGVARAYAGLQLDNGVSSLGSHYNVPEGAQPYYRAGPAVNPTLAQRYGGRAQQAPGALTLGSWHDQYYANTPTSGGGPGTLSFATAVRRRLGWSA